MLSFGLLCLAFATLWWIPRAALAAARRTQTWFRPLGVVSLILLLAMAAGQSPLALLGLGMMIIAVAIHFRGQLAATLWFLCRGMLWMLSWFPPAVSLALRLRLHLVGAIVAFAFVGYELYRTYGNDLHSLTASKFGSVSLGFAVIGFALGYQVGLRLQHTERSSPVFFGLAGAAIGYMAAPFLLPFSFLLAVVALLVFLIGFAWPTVHDSVVGFAANSGRSFRPRRARFGTTLDRLEKDHAARVAAIERLSLPEPEQTRLLAEETHRYLRALDAATAADDQEHSSPPQGDISAWFDPPQGNTP